MTKEQQLAGMYVYRERARTTWERISGGQKPDAATIETMALAEAVGDIRVLRVELDQFKRYETRRQPSAY